MEVAMFNKLVCWFAGHKKFQPSKNFEFASIGNDACIVCLCERCGAVYVELNYPDIRGPVKISFANRGFVHFGE
jgi:hypothetical protein